MFFLPHHKVILKSLQSRSNIKNLIYTTEFYITGYNYTKYEYNDTITDTLVFLPQKENIIYYNSFIPVIEIYLSDISDGVLVEVFFKLKKSIQVIIAIMTAFATILQMGIIISFISGQLIIELPFGIFPLCLPLIIVVFLYTVGFISIRISSNSVIKCIKQVIS